MWVCWCVARSLASVGEGREEQEGRAAPTQATRELTAQGWGVPRPPGPVSPAVAEPAGTGPGRRAHPSPAPAAPAAPPGRTHSMIRETCSRTGTLRSLKAVVMKQPKVSAAITLSEKAKSEFARDSTVFIVTPFPQEPCRRRPSPGSASPPPRCRPVPPTRAPGAHLPGARAAAAQPRPLSGARHLPERARSHPLGHTHRAAGHALGGAVLSVTPPISGEHWGWLLPQGSRLLPGTRPCLVPESVERAHLPVGPQLCFGGLPRLNYTCDIHFQNAWS